MTSCNFEEQRVNPQLKCASIQRYNASMYSRLAMNLTQVLDI